jgi:hypothetical protein
MACLIGSNFSNSALSSGDTVDIDFNLHALLTIQPAPKDSW